MNDESKMEEGEKMSVELRVKEEEEHIYISFL